MVVGSLLGGSKARQSLATQDEGGVLKDIPPNKSHSGAGRGAEDAGPGAPSPTCRRGAARLPSPSLTPRPYPAPGGLPGPPLPLVLQGV